MVTISGNFHFLEKLTIHSSIIFLIIKLNNTCPLYPFYFLLHLILDSAQIHRNTLYMFQSLEGYFVISGRMGKFNIVTI